jgi:hypothetical protein
MSSLNENMINNIGGIILKYQKENNIKSECITNCQFMYDIINRYGGSNIKFKPVFVYSKESREIGCDGTLCVRHLVLEFTINGKTRTIDPSYEIISMEDPAYCDNIKDFVSFVKTSKTLNIKLMIKRFLKFVDVANQLNNDCIYKNDKYYKELEDHVSDTILERLVALIN